METKLQDQIKQLEDQVKSASAGKSEDEHKIIQKH